MTSSGTPVQYLPIDEFRETGYLQEANRLFFHPIGLAIETHSGWSREHVEGFLADKGVQFGANAIDNIMTFVHHAKLDQEGLGRVWDYRDDPEGLIFADGVLDNEKAQRVQMEIMRRAPVRQERLGYVVQPLPEE